MQEADRLDSAPGGSKSDLNLQFGWYRFNGGAGTMMPTSCKQINKCGTQATSWLQGQHPSVSDGVITATVCFHWKSCCDFPVSVRIRNCGAFYVYELMRTPYGLRYCGTKSKKRIDFHSEYMDDIYILLINDEMNEMILAV